MRPAAQRLIRSATSLRKTLRAVLCWVPGRIPLTLHAPGKGRRRIGNASSYLLLCRGGMERRSHVYMLASRRNGTLYTGSTIDLARRVHEHRTGAMPGFTRDYGVTMLVWYEEYSRIIDARIREYAIKRWRRAWKLALIEAFNPAWRDLYDDLGF